MQSGLFSDSIYFLSSVVNQLYSVKKQMKSRILSVIVAKVTQITFISDVQELGMGVDFQMSQRLSL